MSLDYGLTLKANRGLNKAELETGLAGKYEVTDITLTTSGNAVQTFTLRPLDQEQAKLVGGLEFWGEPSWIMATSVYNYEPEAFRGFCEILVDVAKLLGSGIKDWQTNMVFDDPDEFLKQDLEAIRLAQADTVGNMDDILRQAGVLKDGDERVI